MFYKKVILDESYEGVKMKQVKDSKRISAVFIPDFIVKTLKSRGMELIDLETNLITNKDNTLTWLKDNLSKLDIKDWVSINHMLNSKLLPRQKNKMSYGFSTDDDNTFFKFIESDIRNKVGMLEDVVNMEEIVKLYTNDKVDIKSIILSNNHNELPYTFVQGNDTVFVIISEGFMNFIVYNIKEFKETFVSSLVDYSFKGLGELRTTRSELFMDYISLKLTK